MKEVAMVKKGRRGDTDGEWTDDGGGNEGHDRGYGSSEEMTSMRNDKKIEKMKSHFTTWAMLIPKYNR